MDVSLAIVLLKNKYKPFTSESYEYFLYFGKNRRKKQKEKPVIVTNVKPSTGNLTHKKYKIQQRLLHRKVIFYSIEKLLHFSLPF